MLLAGDPALAARAHKSHAAQHAVKAKTQRHAAPAKHKSRSAKRHAKRKHVAHARTQTSHRKARRVAHRRAPARHVARAPQHLTLRSQVAYVVDQATGQVVYQKNASAVMPIASLTKLMTGVIIADAKLPMDEKITITDADVDRIKFSSSHLAVGTVLTRRQALHLALMASENRAAHALARTYPGGMNAFVSAMNVKAQQLGMDDTRYVEPTGLSSANHSSARDLAVLAASAAERPVLREFTTSPAYRLPVAGRSVQFRNTNMLVRDPSWKIGLQKTGFINEAGQCLLLQTKVLGRKLLMVFLHSRGTLARIRDAQRTRTWVRAHPHLLPSGDGEAQARSKADDDQS